MTTPDEDKVITKPIKETSDARLDEARAEKAKAKKKSKPKKPKEGGVSIEAGGRKGTGRTVQEAARNLKQQDLGKDEGDFRDTLEKEGAPRASITLQMGHDVSAFQAAPARPGYRDNPLQFTRIDCVEGLVEACDGRASIRVPLVRADVHEFTKEGILSVDLAASKETFKKPGKDEEVELKLSQTWEHVIVSRVSLQNESETTKEVVMLPGDTKGYPNLAPIHEMRKTSVGRRVVVSAEALKQVAEYAAKHGDGTILLDIKGHEDSLYCETPVDECGVAEMIVSPYMIEDHLDPYMNAYQMTQR